jgi:hypothetical protein
LSIEERARILIGKGVIVPADAPDQVEIARSKLKQTEAEASGHYIVSHKELDHGTDNRRNICP